MYNIEWAQQQMRAKTATYTLGGGGSATDWRDRCGAIAAIENVYAKALAGMIIWPRGDWTDEYQTVCRGLSEAMLAQCAEDKRQARTVPLSHLAERMANMVVHMRLYDLWDYYTIKGRLHFANIPLEAESYRKAWFKYETLMLDLYDRWCALADHDLGVYRQQMKTA